MADITFTQLLKVAGNGETEKLEEKREALEKKLVNLQARVVEAQREISEVEIALSAPIRSAVKAAKELGIEVPEKYAEVTRTNRGRGRSPGKYMWESNGLMPKQEDISRAMWRLSKGSGGSAGNEGQEVLTVAEFWALVKEQVGKTEEELELGEKIKVNLPNGREIEFRKIEE